MMRTLAKPMRLLFFVGLMVVGMILPQQTLKAEEKNHSSLKEQFDQLLNESYSATAPGVSVLVMRKGEVLYRKATGLANVELNVPLTPDNVFRIGSITKQFTAVAIMQLVEEGKLKLDDEITQFLPDYPTHGKTISVEHLLTHTSGIKSYTSMKKWDQEMMRKDFTPMELIEFFQDEPMDFDPGTEFRYNNSGYVLLGYIIEKVSGMSYEDYVERKLFEPLGMKHSYYGSASRIIPNRASGYQPQGERIANANYLSMTQPYAAGSLLSTVDDLYTWYSSVMAGKVISFESLDRATTRFLLKNGEPTNYGYGWFLGNLNGSPTIEHGGGINGFLTESIYLPKEEVFVCVLSNTTGQSPSNLATRLAALAIGKPFEFQTIRLEPDAQKEYAGVYAINGDERRVITLEGEQLYSQRSGGQRFKIYPYQKDCFFFEDSFTTLHFLRDSAGVVCAHEAISRLGTGTARRTDEAVPQHKEVELPVNVLQRYVGAYEILPQFVITVTLEGDQLKAQATGQPAVEIYPEAENRFFYRVVDAQIEFEMGDAETATKLILTQGGRIFEGVRK